MARSKDDDKLDIRSNYELIKVYTKGAIFLFVLIGVNLTIYAISQYIILPILNSLTKVG